MAKHATVDEYIAAIPEPLREVAAKARAVIDAELDGAASAIKWSHPTWSIGKAPICYLKTASRRVTSAFGAARRSTTRPVASRPRER